MSLINILNNRKHGLTMSDDCELPLFAHCSPFRPLHWVLLCQQRLFELNFVVKKTSNSPYHLRFVFEIRTILKIFHCH